MQRILTLVEYRAVCNGTLKTLQESTSKLGWELNIVDNLDPLTIDDGSFTSKFSDFVFWRALKIPTHQEAQRVRLALLRKGVIGVNMNPIGGMSITSDKFFQHGIMDYPGLEGHRLPIFLALSKENVKILLELGKISFPFVIKPNDGTLGQGIVLCSNMDDLLSYNGDLRLASVQPYIDSDFSWRVFVMGGVGMGAMKKYGNDDPGDFVAKCSGVRRVPEEDKKLEEKLCYLAAKATVAAGLEYSGIDLMQDKKDGKIYVIENNIVASWIGGFKEVVGINMAEELLHWYEDRGIYKEQPKYKCMEVYLKNRMKYLSAKKRLACEKILGFEENLADDKNWYDGTLPGKIKQIYSEVSRGEFDRKEVDCLIEEIEDRTEFEFCGNFIGGDILEDACETTARYVAICKRVLNS